MSVQLLCAIIIAEFLLPVASGDRSTQSTRDADRSKYHKKIDLWR